MSPAKNGTPQSNPPARASSCPKAPPDFTPSRTRASSVRVRRTRSHAQRQSSSKFARIVRSAITRASRLSSDSIRALFNRLPRSKKSPIPAKQLAALSVPSLPVFVMCWLWWTRGRDPERDVVTVQYEPPDKLTPGECGTLVDNQAAMRDITATLVDLAVKGYITIEQKDQSGLLGPHASPRLRFPSEKASDQWNDVRPHERASSGLFFGGDITQN